LGRVPRHKPESGMRGVMDSSEAEMGSRKRAAT
jgi:hypothetical protein